MPLYRHFTLSRARPAGVLSRVPQPSDISGLVAWHRADFGVTQVGDTVSGWADKSGNGHDLAQSNSLFRPDFVAATGSMAINSKPVIFFGTGGQPKALTWTAWQIPSVSTVYVVERYAQRAALTSLIVSNGSGPSMFNGGNGTTTGSLNVPLIHAGGGHRVSWSAVLATQTPVLLKFVTDMAGATNESYAIQANNATEVTAASALSLNSGQFLSIGNSAANDLTSWIAEVAVYDHDLTESEEARFQKYVRYYYDIAT